MTRFVIFDLDGTLVDSQETKFHSLAALWHDEFGVSVELAEAKYREISGASRREVFDYVATQTGGKRFSDTEFEKISDEFTRRNIAALRNLPMVVGATDFLRNLKSRGVRTAISSSAAMNEVRGRFSGKPEENLFDEIFGTEGVFGKGPGHVGFLVQKYGIDRKSMLMVGDEPKDLELARVAGVRIALVALTHPIEKLSKLTPDLLVRNLADLAKIDNL